MQEKKKSGGNRNRTAGHGFELEVINRLKETKMFPHVVSTRSENRTRDGQKVDIINRDELKNGRLPYNFQCKNTCRVEKYHELLAEMPKGTAINVVMHKRTKRTGARFNTIGYYAILRQGDFIDLIKELERLKKMEEHFLGE